MDPVTLGMAKADAKKNYVSVKEAAPTPLRFYQPGDANDTASINRALASGATEIHIPVKQSGAPWDISSTITIPAGVTGVTCDEGVSIRAVSTISGPMVDTPVGTRITRHFWRGGEFNCNDLATNGFYLRNFSDFKMENFSITSPVGDGLIIADPSTSANPPTGAKVSGFTISYPLNHAAHAANVGLKLNQCTDGWFQRGSIVGFTKGVEIGASGGGNIFILVHPWGWPNALPTDICFDDYGKNNKFLFCLADTPQQYGYRFRNSWANPTILGGGCFMYYNSTTSVGGPDNVAMGIKIDGTAPVGKLRDITFEGNASARLAKAVDFDETTNTLTSTGHTYENVVNTKTEQVTIKGRYPLNVEGFEGGLLKIVGTTGPVRRANFLNGILLRGFSDDTTTEMWRMDATTGAIYGRRVATGSRPSAATVGVGGQIFDTTLNKPIWSDGTNWKDAAGTVV